MLSRDRGPGFARGLGVLVLLVVIGALALQPELRHWLVAVPATPVETFSIEDQLLCPGDQILVFQAIGPIDWLKSGDLVALALVPAPATPLAGTPASPATPRQSTGPPINQTAFLEDVVILRITPGAKDGAAMLLVAVPPRYDVSSLGYLPRDVAVRPIVRATDDHTGRSRASCPTPAPIAWVP
jgi:hypothetical protein